MSDLSETGPARSGLGTILERGKPFPETAVWAQQRRFYDRHGARAWKGGGVPLYITNNPLIADLYGRVAAAFLREAPEPAPVVLELGSGTGRFGYLLARSLKLRLGSAGFRLILSDFTQTNLSSLASHPRLRPLLQQGVVDLARFDATGREPPRYLSGEEMPSQPMLVIANYVFGALPAHLFRWQDGRLQEALPILMAERDGEPHELIERLLLPLDYEYRPCGEDYFAQPGWNEILRERAGLENTTFLFPSACLACLEHLFERSAGRLFLLAADKGYRHAAEMRIHSTPPMIRCGGSLSLPVDFSALSRRLEQLGGRALEWTPRTPVFRVAAWVAGWPPESLPAALHEFGELERFGPHDLIRLTEGLRPGQLDSGQRLSLLRLSRWDPHLCRRLFGSTPPEVRSQVEGNCFPLSGLAPPPAGPATVPESPPLPSPPGGGKPAERQPVPDGHPWLPLLLARVLAYLAGEMAGEGLVEAAQWGWDRRFAHRLRLGVSARVRLWYRELPPRPCGPVILLRPAHEAAPTAADATLVWDGSKLRLEATGLPATARMVSLLEDEFGPDDFERLRRGLPAARLDLGALLSLLRLSGYDHHTFLHCSRRLAELAPGAAPELRDELRGVLDRTAAAYFPLGGADDPLDELGRVGFSLG